MTEEKFKIAETLICRIKSLSGDLDSVVRLNGKKGSDVMEIRHDSKTILYLHACDELTHEILRLVIARLSEERDALVKEFETL